MVILKLTEWQKMVAEIVVEENEEAPATLAA